MDELEFPIYSAAIACDDQFEIAREEIVSGALALKDLQQRFWAWANNSGVFAEPFMRLDVRLRGHGEPQRMILILIDLIVKNLKTALRLHLESGVGPGGAKSGTATETSNETVPPGSDLLSKLKHLEGTFHGISGALERLDRLASMIERSSRRSLPGRIQAFAENGKASFLRYEMLANAIIFFKYPHANDLLKHQLGRSLVYRKQRISYRLNRQTVYEGKLDRNKKENQTRASRSSSNPAGLNAGAPFSNPPSTHPSTFISEDFKRLQGLERQKQTASPQRPVSTVSSWVGEVEVEYPKPPSLDEGLSEMNAERKLQCQFCGKMYVYKDLKDEKWWRKHVDEDLDVFVCIAEECANPPVGFSKYSLWRKHMESEHGIDWMHRIHHSSEGRTRRRPDESISGDTDTACLLCKMPVDMSVTNQDTGDAIVDDSKSGRHDLENTTVVKPKRKVRFSESFLDGTTEINPEFRADRVVDRDLASSARRAKLSKHIAGHLRVLCFQTLSIDLDQEGDTQNISGGHSVNLRASKEESVARSPRDELDSVSFSFAKSSSSQQGDKVPPSDLHTIEAHTNHSTPISDDPRFLSTFLRPDDESDDESVFGGIWEQIDEKLVSPPPDESKEFLPLDDLHRIISRPNVRRELKEQLGLPVDAIHKYANHVCDATEVGGNQTTTRKKLFATLVRIEHLNALPDLIAEGLHDLHLPLELQRESPWHFCYRAADGGLVEFEGSRKWSKPKLLAFAKEQWIFLSPFFDMSATEPIFYSFESKIVLPFVEFESSPLDTAFGGVGDVFHRKIHAAHHNYDTIANPAFAIKKLHSKDKQEFDQELIAFKKFNRQDHPHVVKLLATYHYREHYYFMFPWADGNLRELWQRYNTPQRVHKLVVWLAQQACGIASGLQLIQHPPKDAGANLMGAEDFGRHGDLKPENVLWFCDDPPEREFFGGGHLRISDFGLTRYHRGLSSQIVKLQGMERFSLTYKAPEVDVHSSVSQAYDIWTLGMLLLEFVVWYFKGWEGVDNFSVERAQDSHDPDHEIPMDTFFDIIYEQGKGSGAVLKPSVTTLIESLHNHPDCSLFFHSLLTYILHHMICISPGQRDKCDAVVSKLQKMAILCEDDSVYAFQGCPKPRNRTDAADVDKPLSTLDSESKFDENRPRPVSPIENTPKLVSDMSAAAFDTLRKPPSVENDRVRASNAATHSANPHERQKKSLDEDEDDGTEDRRKRVRLLERSER